MSLELTKGMRMLGDLVSYLYYEGAKDFEMRLKHEKDSATEIRLSCLMAGLNPAKLDMIRRMLQVPRQREVEQNFWELSGEMDFGGEIALAGVMSDRAEVNYIGEKLSVTLYRNAPSRL